MICKIDIEKAFDSVEWLAIITILQKMRFPEILMQRYTRDR